MGRFIFIQVSSQCCLLHLECLDLPELSNLDNMEEVVDIELLSLSEPRFGEGKGDLIV